MLLLRITSATSSFLVASIILHIYLLNARDFKDFFYKVIFIVFLLFGSFRFFNFRSLTKKFNQKSKNRFYFLFKFSMVRSKVSRYFLIKNNLNIGVIFSLTFIVKILHMKIYLFFRNKWSKY